MPYLSGPIRGGRAIIDVLVGISRPRRLLLQKHNFPIPAPVHVRALIDTGADISGFSPRVFRELDITPITKTQILTPSTPAHTPFETALYDVSLGLVADGASHPFPDTRVMEADCWHPGEEFEALIGTDILGRCFFQYIGLDRRFTLAF